MEKFVLSLFLVVIFCGCCNCGQREEKVNVEDVSVQDPQQNLKKENVEKKDSEDEAMTDKEREFASDVDFIYNFTLQHGFNPNAKKPGTDGEAKEEDTEDVDSSEKK